MMARILQERCWALVALLGLGLGVVELDAQVQERPAVGAGIVHVRSISPRSGPAGTEVMVRAEGLPINTAVYVALAALHSGYEVLSHTQTNESGELIARVKVPDQHRGHWDHTQVIMVFREELSRMMATSDPFHITNEEGFVQRNGVVEMVEPHCPGLKGWDGLTYALVGGQAASLAASAGSQVTVEGPIVEGTCGLQNAIEVVRVTSPLGGP